MFERDRGFPVAISRFTRDELKPRRSTTKLVHRHAPESASCGPVFSGVLFRAQLKERYEAGLNQSAYEKNGVCNRPPALFANT
jgi:hypothetical protein